MKALKPTIRLIIEKSKKRKSDGRFPLYILVTWKFTRAKEYTGIHIYDSELTNLEPPEKVAKRIEELENISTKFINDIIRYNRKGIRFDFTARDILDSSPKKPEQPETEEEEGYKVYIHILPNNSIYIGQTKDRLKKRWRNGEGYKGNTEFHDYIEKYGWDNIQHLLYKDKLTETEADIIERDLIKFYSRNESATGLKVLNIKHNRRRKAVS